MIDVLEFLWNFSPISILVSSFRLLTKALSMPLCANSPKSPSPIPWMGLCSPAASAPACKDVSGSETYSIESLPSQPPVAVPKGSPTGKYVSCKQNIGQEFLQHGSQNHIVPLQGGLDSLGFPHPGKLRKRPARIVIPKLGGDFGFGEASLEGCEREVVEVEGRDFYLASKKGRRRVMEDGYGFIPDVCGNSKQAFFGVFDGHGGREAVDYVAEKLGTNIVTTIAEFEKEKMPLEQAIKAGYLTTDKEFLTQGVGSGVCAATVLVKDGQLHVSNVGDCRVVLSKKGIAHPLTNDHRVDRQDERFRIENSGGFVSCHNGVWRVHGSLAVSRAIGDAHLKEWVVSEPETKNLHLTSDCDFLIVASDGLWDKVPNQEAVDVVLRHKDSIESCKKLVEISSSRGTTDDITVMVINLKKYLDG